MARFCQRCGTPAGEADRFCGSCGNAFDAISDTAPPVAAASPAPAPAALATPDPPLAPAPTEIAPDTRARVETVFRRVGNYLRAADIKFMENPGEQSYTALYGSAVAMVKVIPAGPDDTWVAFLAPVVSGAGTAPDLLEYLLRRNADWAATKYHLTQANEIWLQYSVLGSILDANVCKLAIAFTMMTADAEDDVIRSKWGGRRASEVLLGSAS